MGDWFLLEPDWPSDKSSIPQLLLPECQCQNDLCYTQLLQPQYQIQEFPNNNNSQNHNQQYSVMYPNCGVGQTVQECRNKSPPLFAQPRTPPPATSKPITNGYVNWFIIITYFNLVIICCAIRYHRVCDSHNASFYQYLCYMFIYRVYLYI